MIRVLVFLFQLILSFFNSDKNIRVHIMLLKKENQVLRRKIRLQRIRIDRFDKFILVFLNLFGDIKNLITIVSPGTLLNWQNKLIKSFWSFKQKEAHPGRPPVHAEIKNIILEMKNNNLFWGAKKIRDELLMKLNISLHKKTIQNILKDFRRRGKIKKSLTWKNFLESQVDSIFAMDFFTVDTMFNQRFYVHFIICHKTREIVQFAISQFPNREFVKQQMIEFEEKVKRRVYMIRDRTGQFYLDYSFYNIVDVCTSVQAPNMKDYTSYCTSLIRLIVKSINLTPLPISLSFFK